MGKKVSAILLVIMLITLTYSAVWAAKCTRELPEEVFAFFGQKAGAVSCDDYEYRLVDLDEDRQDEIFVTNYRKSCEEQGWCDFEVFGRVDRQWKHLVTIPGRIKVLDSKTKGYRDLATWNKGRRFVFVWDGKQYRESLLADIERVPSEISQPTPQ